MKTARNFAVWICVVLVAIYVGAGGAAKLAGVPYVHSSFPKLGLPAWFGYFIGLCEVLGSIALFIRPLRPLAASGIAAIMVGATYYHAVYTPVVQAVPAFVLTLLSAYIVFTERSEFLNFQPVNRGTPAGPGTPTSI